MLSANLDQAKEVGPRREGYFCAEDDCLHRGRIATGLTALAMTEEIGA